MQNLKYNLFDFFTFFLPGAFSTFTIVIFFSGIEICNEFSDIYTILDESVNLYSSITFVFISYIIGFVTSVFSSYVIKAKEYWFPPIKGNKCNLTNSEKYLIARHLSEKNFLYIERWNVLSNMSSSFALSIILISVFAYFYYSCFSPVYLFLSLIIGIVLIKQSTKYKSWVNIDLDNLVYMITNQDDKYNFMLVTKEKSG